MGIRHYPDKVRVYVDMDGVIADFEGAARAHAMEPSHFKRVAGAFLDLDPIPGAAEAVAALDAAGYLVFALTKIPRSNPHAATEKLLWVRRHFPSLDDRIIITPDKGAVGKARDFLVDDHPEWANASNFPGTVIVFTGDWKQAMRQIVRPA
ncbi:hypothetical protein QM326_34780 [Burkholderia cenocepacia]|jgi:5'(3')-deoxyribonucleotidase|nr:hypothetical protein [Burkholderia cenocepacia]